MPELEPGAGVGHAEAVRPDEEGTTGSGNGDSLRLEQRTLRAELGQSGGDRHDRPRLGRDGVLHRRHQGGRRDADDDELERLPEGGPALHERGVRRAAEHLAAARVDQGHRAGASRFQGPAREDVAPLGGIVARPHDRDRAGREERLQTRTGESVLGTRG